MTENVPPADNTRGLLKSMMVMGSAQFLSILIRILRAKLVAVLLGPSGTGLLSMFSNLQMLGSQAAGLGLAQSGVRELSAAKGDAEALSRVRRVLLGALVIQGAIAMVLIWLAREALALRLLGSTNYSLEVGVVGVAVFLFLITSSQGALLQGLRRIGDLGRVMVWGTLLGTVAGLVPVVLLGQNGLIALILLPPAISIFVAWHYTRRLPAPTTARMTPRDIWQAWRPMAKLGMAFMLGGLLTTATLLLVRTLITRDLGLEAAGQFAAAWTITVVYGGFMIKAMQADYFPRLSETMHDHGAATRLINTQAQLTLAISGPVLLFMIGLAPWVMQLLYSKEFNEAATLLQWQMVGSLFKVTAWSLGQALPASGRSGLYLVRQIPLNLALFFIVWFGLPVFGLEAAGIAFLCAYIVHLAVVTAFARRYHDFRWHRRSLRLLFLHMVLCSALLVAARAAPELAAIAAVVLAVLTSVTGLRAVIVQIGSQHGRLVSRIACLYKLIGWPVTGSN